MMRLALAAAVSLFAVSAMAGSFVTRTVQDGSGAHLTLYYDVSGNGTGPFVPAVVYTDGAGNVCTH